MNNTKWNELRLEMHELKHDSPLWRTKNVISGYVSNWDCDWFYHFQVGGFENIEWVEIKVDDTIQEKKVEQLLKAIHVPGHKIENGFKVYGFVNNGQEVDYV